MTALEAIEEVTRLRQRKHKMKLVGKRGCALVSSEDFRLVVCLIDVDETVSTRNCVHTNLDDMTATIFDADVHGYDVGDVVYQTRKKIILVRMLRVSAKARE